MPNNTPGVEAIKRAVRMALADQRVIAIVNDRIDKALYDLNLNELAERKAWVENDERPLTYDLVVDGRDGGVEKIANVDLGALLGSVRVEE